MRLGENNSVNETQLIATPGIETFAWWGFGVPQGLGSGVVRSSW